MVILKDSYAAGYDYLAVSPEGPEKLDVASTWWFEHMKASVRHAESVHGDEHPNDTIRVGAYQANRPIHELAAEMRAEFALTDWLEHDAKTITVWHGGAAPMGLCPPTGEPGGPLIARHFNIKKPAVVEATLRENMPVTIMRLWRCDGGYHLTAREGKTIKPKRHLMGTNGLAQLDQQDPREWFEELCHAGMPHHVVVFEGHSAGLLKRLARTLNMQFI